LTAINPYKKFSKINPQRENGNRQIASDVFLALAMAKLSGGEYQIILFIIDKTWGFNKLSDSIAYSQIAKATKLTRPAIINNIKKLEKKRILVVNRKVVKGSLPVNEYLFNKHYDTWLDETGKAMFTSSDIELMQKEVKLVKQSLPVKPQLVKQSLPVQAQTGKVSKQKLVKQSLHTKENITKENNIHNNTSNNTTVRNDKIVHKKKEKKKEKKKINFNFDKEEWENITPKDIERWKEAYPACDIDIELAQMREWLLSNPDKKKKNYRRFITNWLSRSQEKGGTKKRKKKSFIDMELERLQKEKEAKK